MAKAKRSTGTKATRDPLFDASLDIATLANLFRVVTAEAQAMIADGDPALELYALTLEALAEKGIREADAASARIHKAWAHHG